MLKYNIDWGSFLQPRFVFCIHQESTENFKQSAVILRKSGAI